MEMVEKGKKNPRQLLQLLSDVLYFDKASHSYGKTDVKH